MVFSSIDMNVDEYLTLKKQLSEKLSGKGKDERKDYVFALADAFSISENEATKVLQDCDNDLRMAIKLLRMQILEKSK